MTFLLAERRMTTSIKTCFKCGTAKPLTEFYRHPQMGDGHLNKCKECTKLDHKLHGMKPGVAERRQAYERSRFSNPERKAKTLIYQRNRRRKDPVKDKARRDLHRALQSGKLQRKPCEVCSKKAQAHHIDYRYPLAVRWLCFEHHRAAGHNQKVRS